MDLAGRAGMRSLRFAPFGPPDPAHTRRSAAPRRPPTEKCAYREVAEGLCSFEREAILATLQSFGLIIRTRGGVSVPAPKCELIT